MSQEVLRQAIAQRRREMGLRQSEVAWRLGIHRLVYHRLETGHVILRPDILSRVLEVLGLDLDGIKGLDPDYRRAMKKWIAEQ
jgi:transcriptional regulator with XRE-family HTH domain